MAAVWNASARRARAAAVRAAAVAGEVTRSVPGAAGALAISWGLGQMYRPLLWISVGLFLMAMDRRMA